VRIQKKTKSDSSSGEYVVVSKDVKLSASRILPVSKSCELLILKMIESSEYYKTQIKTMRF